MVPLQFIFIMLGLLAYFVWAGWWDDPYHIVVAAPLGLITFIVLLVHQRRKNAEIDEEGDDEEGPSIKAMIWWAVVKFCIILAVMSLGMFVSDRTTLSQWFYDQDRPQFEQTIQPLVESDDWDGVEALAVERLSSGNGVSPQWEQELNQLVLEAIIQQARQAQSFEEKKELYDRALAWATEHGLRPDLAQAELALAQPTSTPTPTLTPTMTPTSVIVPTATLAPTAMPTPTVTPQPTAIILPSGTTAEILRQQEVPGAAVVYVRVTGPDGQFFGGLTAYDFAVMGLPIKVTDLSINPAPKSVVLAIDASESMLTSIESAKAAAKEFLATLSSQDEVMVLVFQNNSVTMATDWTSDSRQAAQAIDAIQVYSRTPLNDVLFKGASELAGRSGRRIFVLLSDGEDTSSITTEEQVLRQVPIVGAELYLIALGNVNEQFFAELAGATGGVVQTPHSAADLRAAFDAIAEAIGQQYAVTFDPQGIKQYEITIGSGPSKIELSGSLK